jgi:hypothetical protein
MTAEEECESLEELLVEGFCQIAHLEKDGPRAGWWDTMALSAARNVGDQLVKLGKWERHPDGYGRRWWYRPISQVQGSAK